MVILTHAQDASFWQKKIKIEAGPVQETLTIPLYGRKLYADVLPQLYADAHAAELCTRIDYDFTQMDKQANSTFWRFGALEAAMRQIDMEWEIRDYLTSHPSYTRGKQRVR